MNSKFSYIFGVFLSCFAFLFLFYTVLNAASYKLGPKDILITDFEENPNYLEGNVGSYGASKGSGYTAEEAHSGSKSYKLVFSKNRLWRTEDKEHYDKSIFGLRKIKSMRQTGKAKWTRWASFGIDMGPAIDTRAVPVKIKPYNASGFKYLLFWVKGRQGGEKFRVSFRDAHATTYEPQIKISSNVLVSTKWKLVRIDLKKIMPRVDIKKLVQIGIGFGSMDGNRQGNVIYVDDFIFAR